MERILYLATLFRPYLNHFSVKWILAAAFFIAISVRSVHLSLDMDGWRRATVSILPKGHLILAEAITGSPFIPVVDWGYLDPQHIFEHTPAAPTADEATRPTSKPVAKPVAATNSTSSKRVRQEQYVKRFAKVAQAEMKQFGIPASITLAQGLLESDAGNSRLARNNNNHFGIKCFSRNCSKGHCSNFTDDSHKDFFRKYESAWESYRAHSHFLQRERYQSLHKLSSKDYKRWAKGLLEAGYATDKGYADKLIRMIEELELYKYDR